jgi:hypothetical protein
VTASELFLPISRVVSRVNALRNCALPPARTRISVCVCVCDIYIERERERARVY